MCTVRISTAVTVLLDDTRPLDLLVRFVFGEGGRGWPALTRGTPQAAVCENINLYMEKCEEEFQSYLGTFVHVVWELLLKVRRAAGVAEPRRRVLRCPAMPLLSSAGASAVVRRMEPALPAGGQI